MEYTGLVVEVVFEEEDIIVLEGFGIEAFFVLECFEGFGVVGHDPGHGDMCCRGHEVGHKDDGFAVVLDMRNHLTFGVAVVELESDVGDVFSFFLNEFELTTFLYGEDIFLKVGGFFAAVGVGGPFELLAAGPVSGIGESQLETGFVAVPVDASPAMVEMHMCDDHIGDVFGLVASCFEGVFEGSFTVEVVVFEPFFVLFVADAVVDKDTAVAIHYQQAAHGPVAEVVFVAGIYFLPEHFGHYAKHGAAVEFQVSGVDRNELHGFLVFVDCLWGQR